MLIDIPTTLRNVRDAIVALRGEVAVFQIEPPAEVGEVEAVERIIGRSIPQTLRSVFLEQSARINVYWTIGHRSGLPKVVADELSGGIDISLVDLPVSWENWEGWRPTFENPADHDWPLEFNLDVYDELFPVVTTGNGDQIVVARADDETSDLVVYLSHDGGDFTFAVLSDTLDAFLNTWCQLGCPGPEWCDVARFIDTKALRLSLTTRRSAAWLRALSLAVA